MIAANSKWSWVRPELGLAFLILLGVARISATYPILSQSYDESLHIACGMQWLDQGVFEYEPQHPPLARVASAIGPYLGGLRSTGQPRMQDEGNEILHTKNAYLRNLTLARVGILPFFVAASLLVWFWASELYSKTTALAATFLFTMLPPVLAHAGVATTDMAATATFIGCLFAFQLWIERPSLKRSLLFGLAMGCGVAAKFSVPVFLLPGLAAITILHRLGISSREAHAAAKLAWVKRVAQALMVSIIFVWACYRFSMAPITKAEDRPHQRIDSIITEAGAVRDLSYRMIESVPLPAPELFLGMSQVADHAAAGHSAYLLGETGRRGWWSFFPIAIGIKTPLPFLFLAGAGGAWTVRRRPPAWRCWAPLLCGLGVLLVCLPSSINIGVRHVLPIYPMLAIVGGHAVTCLWQRRYAVAAQAITVALLIWHGTASIRAHPDYLAYFNELAGDHPEEFLVDSDLDWGQGLGTLSEELRQRGISAVSIAYFGTADIYRHKLPAPRELPHGEPRAGWIAISISTMKKDPDGFTWIEDYEPVALIRKSIRLYHIP